MKGERYPKVKTLLSMLKKRGRKGLGDQIMSAFSFQNKKSRENTRLEEGFANDFSVFQTKQEEGGSLNKIEI